MDEKKRIPVIAFSKMFTVSGLGVIDGLDTYCCIDLSSEYKVTRAVAKNCYVQFNKRMKICQHSRENIRNCKRKSRIAEM